MISFTKKSFGRFIGFGACIAFAIFAFQNCAGGSGSPSNVSLNFDLGSASFSAVAGMPSQTSILVGSGLSTDAGFNGSATITDDSSVICPNNISISGGQGSGTLFLINNSGGPKTINVTLSIQGSLSDGSTLQPSTQSITVPARAFKTTEPFIIGNKPSPRSFHSAIYDPIKKQMFIFGGRTSSIISGSEVVGNTFNDTWAFDPSSNSWTPLVTSNTPTARYLSGAAFDSKRERMIIFGGKDLNGNLTNSVWALDLNSSSWTQISVTGNSPTARSGSGLHYDQIGDRIFALGISSTSDNAWTFYFDSSSSGHWVKNITSGTEPSTSVIPGLDLAITSAFIPSISNIVSTLNDFAVSNLSWSVPSAPYQGENFVNGSLIYDPQGLQTVSIGGGCCLNPLTSGNTFNATQAKIFFGADTSASGNFPVALHGHSSIYDPINLQMITFGGESVSASSGTPVIYSVSYNNDVFLTTLPRKTCP